MSNIMDLNNLNKRIDAPKRNSFGDYYREIGVNNKNNLYFVAIGIVIISSITFFGLSKNWVDHEVVEIAETISGQQEDANHEEKSLNVGDEVMIKLDKQTKNDSVAVKVWEPNSENPKTIDLPIDDQNLVKIGSDTLNQTGEYKYSMSVDGKNQDGSFKVESPVASANKSTFRVSKTEISADGDDGAIINLILKDKKGQAISGKKVYFKSDRESDIIDNLNIKTDSKGNIKAIIKSTKSGIATIRAFDEAGKILPITANAQFINGKIASNFEGNAELAQISQSSIDHFNIEVMTNDVIASTPLPYLRIKSVDRSDGIIKDYKGRIKIESSDKTALLPSEYLFTADNFGEKSFDIGIKLNQLGEQTITVTDVDKPEIKGEIKLQVRSEAGATNKDTPISVDITPPIILTPSDSTTIGKNNVTVAGITEPDATIYIYDNEKEILKITANNKGSFKGDINELVDGNHKITAFADLRGKKSPVSESINITVDSQAPTIYQVAIRPEQALPRARIDVEIKSEPDLQKVKIILDKRTIELNESNNGTYKGWFYAPEEAGKYQVDVLIGDNLGNNQKYIDKGTVEVTNTPNLNIVATKNNTNDVIDINDPRCTGVFKDALIDPVTGEKICKPNDYNNNLDTSNNDQSNQDLTSLVSNINQSNQDNTTTNTTNDNGFCTNNTNITTTEITDSTMDSVTLSWKTIENAVRYKIYFGKTKTNMNLEELTTLGKTDWTLSLPSSSKTWYFAVVPIDISNNECDISGAKVVKLETKNIDNPIIIGTNVTTENIKTIKKIKTIPQTGPDLNLIISIIALATWGVRGLYRKW